MKKLSLLLIVSLLVLSGCSSETGTKNEKVEEKTVKSKEPQVVYTVSDEDRNTNGTLSDGIHSTSIWLDALVANIETFDEIGNTEPLMDYVKGANKLAEKVNASKEIKVVLNKVLKLTEQGLANKDITKLHQANDILIELDYNYNRAVFSKDELEQIEAKLK
ncbi:lipoprotein [Bacillus massiliigorillae]|uniref:lipoprotein n=1 Tax=Bacillus massiliigorillae TaxID=1243664 RepID=UPI00039B335F|nr:lipoprotein [Bacillus massiliigorillae]